MYTPEFKSALAKVLKDIGIDEGSGADLVAVGIERNDCLELAVDILDDKGEDQALLIAMLVQVAVAVGVWIERNRRETSQCPEL